MTSYNLGIYKYSSLYQSFESNLPINIRVDDETATVEAILLRLLAGGVRVNDSKGNQIIQNINYFELPYSKKYYTFNYKNISTIFDENYDSNDLKNNPQFFNNYLNGNRKNHNVFEHVLLELTTFMFSNVKSPIAGFANLYRCLEYISYCFPLVYAAKSKNYKGTYKQLHGFFNCDSQGELKFFKTFLKTLIEDENIMDYPFDISLDKIENLESFSTQCSQIFRESSYEIDGNAMKIKFINILDFFITTRNRYFHMKIGEGQNNFTPKDYNMDSFLEQLNFHLLNWISNIIMAITRFSYTET
ncbi:hypothetical protein [Breznakia pachnodae]|uniref:ApeA N-terminal domain-containing protein n=1 Tax=Breznakia pachnodae TaxID=265178 RepID=A0ABU0E5J8_9FIRM|nr:hypothetical protein [Breznakia pachnodae]MDQ0362174.1 hypothetical protein [Breznakia pachnodae]